MKRILVVIIALFIIAGGISFTDRYVVNATEVSTQDEETVFYKGLVNSKVNVRLGPGTEYDKLVVDDKQVQLNSGDEVVIIGEAKATSGIVWYNVSFEYNGATVEGFSTSSYIAKTDETITPTPLPTPSPTSTPTPKPEPTLTSVPTEAVKQLEAKDDARTEKENDIKKYIVLVLAAFGVFIVLIIVLKLVRRKKKNVNSDMSVKVDKLKKVKIEEADGKGKKRKPEIKKLSDDVPVVETTREEVYLAGIEPDDSVYNEDYPTTDASGILESASKEAEEKKALRAEIERLQEHDIVVHKYFGEGEVYDNSDVNLLEVRFENDVRFLNKDSLVSKKLLEVFDDEQQIYKRRSTTKKGGKKSSMNKKN